jgi:hypothetical protein
MWPLRRCSPGKGPCQNIPRRASGMQTTVARQRRHPDQLGGDAAFDRTAQRKEKFRSAAFSETLMGQNCDRTAGLMDRFSAVAEGGQEDFSVDVSFGRFRARDAAPVELCAPNAISARNNSRLAMKEPPPAVLCTSTCAVIEGASRPRANSSFGHRRCDDECGLVFATIGLGHGLTFVRRPRNTRRTRPARRYASLKRQTIDETAVDRVERDEQLDAPAGSSIRLPAGGRLPRS